MSYIRYVFIIIIITILGVPISAVGAGQTVVVNFSDYPNATPVTALSEPNMTFSSTGGIAEVGNMNSLILDAIDPGTIEVSLTTPATYVSFAYLFGGSCAVDDTIELFLGGVSADHTVVSGCSSGVYIKNVTFDHLILTSTTNGINTLSIFGPMTFIFPGTEASLHEDESFIPADDRVNHTDKDRAAPVAIYCKAHGIEARRIDPVTSIGIDPPSISLSYEDIEAAGVPATENLLLAENQGVSLYRLTTGEFQVNVLNANTYEYKWYIFVWDQCQVPSRWYHLSN